MCKGEIDSFQESDYICKNCSSDKYNLIKNLEVISNGPIFIFNSYINYIKSNLY